MKRCFKCKKEKPFSEFYKNKTRKDGYQSWCYDCGETYRRKNQYDPKVIERKRLASERFDNSKKGKAYAKEYSKRPGVASRRTKVNRKWREEYLKDPTNAAKYKARCLTTYAIQTGKLKRKPCSVCKKPKAEAHHRDYAKPFDVIWLCHRCHLGEHKKLRKLRKEVSREKFDY